MARFRFVIYTQPRTGGTWLSDLLDSHPALQCERELFNPDWTASPPVRWRRALEVAPLPYLEYRAWCCPRRVYGFKLLQYQVPQPRALLSGLHWLGWRIVNLRRKNIWQQTLSHLLARQTGRYHRRAGEAAANTPVTLDPQALLAELAWQTRAGAVEDALLTGLPHLRLEYEHDLLPAAARAGALARVYAYLGVPDAPATTTLLPTYDRPFAEVIANYSELVAAVAQSSFAAVLASQ